MIDRRAAQRLAHAHERKVLLDRDAGVPAVACLAAVQPEPAPAKPLHRVRGVRHEEQRHPSLDELTDPAHALVLEVGVAHREGLVDDQHVGLHVCLHGEGEPQHHPARVELHGLFDELADVGERGDLVEPALHLGLRDVQDRAVQEDILASRELRVEATAQFEQRRHTPGHRHLARRGGERPGDDLEERALAATVASDDPDRLSPADLEARVPQRPKFATVRLPEPPQQLLLQAVLRAVVEAVHLAHVAYGDHDRRVATGLRLRAAVFRAHCYARATHVAGMELRRHRRSPISSS